MRIFHKNQFLASLVYNWFLKRYTFLYKTREIDVNCGCVWIKNKSQTRHCYAVKNSSALCKNTRGYCLNDCRRCFEKKNSKNTNGLCFGLSVCRFNINVLKITLINSKFVKRNQVIFSNTTTYPYINLILSFAQSPSVFIKHWLTRLREFCFPAHYGSKRNHKCQNCFV